MTSKLSYVKIYATKCSHFEIYFLRSFIMKGKATAGLVLGIVGLVFSFIGSWFSIIALPMAIVGLVLSVSGKKALAAAGQPAGLGTAGLVIGIIAVVFAAIFFFTCGVCVLCVEDAVEGALGDLDDLKDALGDLEGLRIFLRK